MSAFTHLLNTTVQVQRRQVTPDGIGGEEVAWVNIATEGARVSLPAGSATSAVLSAGQSLEQVPFYVYLEPSSEVNRGDVLVDSSDGRKLWVEATVRPSIHAYTQARVREWQTEKREEAESP